MKNLPKLSSIVEPVIKNLGFDLLSLDYIERENKIIIAVNKVLRKINADDCERIHKHLVYILNAENYITNNKYKIEVSSKGLISLSNLNYAESIKGHTVKLFLVDKIKDNKVFFGKLLLINKKKKKLYLQNKKKIFLFYFYQIDKIIMI